MRQGPVLPHAGRLCGQRMLAATPASYHAGSGTPAGERALRVGDGQRPHELRQVGVLAEHHLARRVAVSVSLRRSIAGQERPPPQAEVPRDRQRR